jgi:hypothetical protein
LPISSRIRICVHAKLSKPRQYLHYFDHPQPSTSIYTVLALHFRKLINIETLHPSLCQWTPNLDAMECSIT